MSRAWNIALKDLLVWLRDPAALGVLLGMPIVLIFILGSALGGVADGSSASIKVGVVDLSRGRVTASGTDTPPSDELVEAILESERLADIFVIERLPNELVARELVGEGSITSALIIPVSFDEDVAAGRDTKLVVLKDPGSETSSGIWEGVITSLATRFSAASVSAQTVLQTVQLANPSAMPQMGALIGEAVGAVTKEDGLDGVSVVDARVSGVVHVGAIDYYGLSMSAMFLMFGAMFGAFSTIRERREQTMSRMLATPTARPSIVGGKMLGIFLLGICQFAILYTFTRFVFGVEWGDDVVATFAVAAAEVFAVTGLAILIASVARSERAVGGIGPLVIQIQALLGGAFFDMAVFPGWLAAVRFVSVVGWTMAGWTAIQVRGAGLVEVLGPIAALLVIGLALFGVGVWRMEERR